VAIEMETVFYWHVGQIVHAYNATDRNVFLKDETVKVAHGMHLAKIAASGSLYAQHLRYAFAQHARESAEGSNRHARHLHEGHVCEKQATCKTENHWL
jgi:hypothetical protein